MGRVPVVVGRVVDMVVVVGWVGGVARLVVGMVVVNIVGMVGRAVGRGLEKSVLVDRVAVVVGRVVGKRVVLEK